MERIDVTFPYTSVLSENNRLGWSPRSGRMYAKDEYKQAQITLSLAIAAAKARVGVKFDPSKRVFVELKVYRPNAKSDASNMVKACLDAISRAIGVNDNMFDGSFYGFVDKKNPRIQMDIKQ